MMHVEIFQICCMFKIFFIIKAGGWRMFKLYAAQKNGLLKFQVARIFCFTFFWIMTMSPLLIVKANGEGTAQCEGQADQITEGWNWVHFSAQLQTELTWVCLPMSGPNRVRIIAQRRVGESRQLLAPSQVEKDKEKFSSFMQSNDEPKFV